LKKRKACSTVKRRKYQRHTTLRSAGSGPTDPSQPQGPRWQFLVGQALDLDADHAERSIRRATHVELSPHIYLDCAVHRVIELGRTLRLAMCGFVDQPKRLPMQARPPAAWTLFGGTIHDAALDQTH
jgi:hypothetical protein